jgi:PIN domain nuclease of toxin-antitoxin system
MLNLDTHIFLYALAGELKPREKKLLESNEWSISAIVLWELTKLAQLGRIDLDPADPDLRRIVAGLQVWPIDLDVVTIIPALDFRSDPADEIIAATSITHNVRLLTRDARIRKSKIVPLA